MLISCDGNGGMDKINDFDQKPFLQNIGENIILPAYAALASENQQLAEAITVLKNNPNADNIETARVRLKAARLAWQACTAFQFGPAETFGLSAELNIYPVDQDRIESNISAGSYDLATLSNSDAKGYQAIAFLLYGQPGAGEDVLAALTAGRLAYMEDVVTRIKEASQKVYDEWKADGGNFIATFTADDALGVDVGSSTGKLVNAMNKDFERNTRDGKIGIPVGIRSLGAPIPKNSEAYFAGYSVELLEANVAAYLTLFTGGTDGIGFDDYLNEIGAATTGNEELAASIEAQFGRINTAIEAISDPLPQAISEQKTDVEKIFAEMQALVIYFKTDMASSMGVVISYQDNDGD